MPLTAQQILKSSLPGVPQAAKAVVIKQDDTLTPGFLNRKSNPKLHGAPFLKATCYSTTTGTSIKRTKPENHKVTVLALDNSLPLHKAPVLVSCDCGYFTFYCEVALAKKGSAVVKLSNGENPVDRNPAMLPSPCKHLHAVLTAIVKRKM